MVWWIAPSPHSKKLLVVPPAKHYMDEHKYYTFLNQFYPVLDFY